jgi:hypothetical protein
VKPGVDDVNETAPMNPEPALSALVKAPLFFEVVVPDVGAP